MARRPNVQSDRDNWGAVLNDYLDVSLNADGTIKDEAAAALPISDATEAALEQIPEGRKALIYPDHLSRWRSKLADARWEQAVIACYGDSITRGLYANNSSTTDEPVFASRGWVGQLRARLAQQYGDPGEGIILLSDPRVTKSGTSGAPWGGPITSASLFENGDTATLTTPVCTDIVIYGLWETNALSEPYTYSIDDGAATTSDISTAPSYTLTADVVTGLAETTHKVDIVGPETGRHVVSGVGCYLTRDSGVAVHRLGTSGGYLSGVFLDTEASRDISLRANIDMLGVDLAIVAFGANESGAGQALGKTPETFASLLEDFVAEITGRGASALIVAGPRRDPSSLGSPYTDADFYSAAEAVAADNPHAAFFDLARVWGGYADSADLYHDVIHPNRRGHSDIAKLVYEAIGGV